MATTDEIVEQILRSYASITVVGASNSLTKPAGYVPSYMQRHGWRIVPVNPLAPEVLSEPAYRTLSDVPSPVGLVNLFRPSRACAVFAQEAAEAGATALWLQLGITSDEAHRIADDGGLLYVEDRCLIIEQRRLALEAPKLASIDHRDL